nr:MAG TPA: hypothetical protein [Caudoviricetes sp.]
MSASAMVSGGSCSPSPNARRRTCRGVINVFIGNGFEKFRSRAISPLRGGDLGEGQTCKRGGTPRIKPAEVKREIRLVDAFNIVFRYFREESLLFRVLRVVVQPVGLAGLPDLHVDGFRTRRGPVDDLQRRRVESQHRAYDGADRLGEFGLLGEDHRVERHLVFVEDALGAESRGVVQSAQGPEPRVGHDDVPDGLFVQRLPVAFVLRRDGDEARMVVVAPVADDEHHLPGVPGELLLGEAHDAFGFGFVVRRRVEHHHPRQLERVVQPRDVPAVGFPRHGRDAESRDVGRHAVVFEHRFVILVVDDRPQGAVLLPLELRIEGQRPCFGGFERRPVVVQQDVLRVAGHAAARGVLMVERQEGVLLVGDYFEEGVAEQRLVEGQLVEHLPQTLAAAVDAADERRQQRLPGLVAGESLARDVVGLVVDDAAVGRRTAGHQGQCRREEVVVAPAPESVALDPRRSQREVRVRAVGDPHGGFDFFRFAHGVVSGLEAAARRDFPAGARSRVGLLFVGVGDQGCVEDLASGHEYRALAVLHLVGVVPHAHLVAGHVGRVDRQHEVAAVGQHAERLVVGGSREVAAQPEVDDRNPVVGECPAAVHRIGVGGVGALRIEVFLVEVAEIGGDEERQLSVGLEVLNAQVGLVPQLVEQLHDVGRVGERRLLIGEVVDGLVADLGGDRLQKAVEGVVARCAGRVADPHRGADVLGEGLPEEHRFGLFEVGAREVVHVDVGQRRDLFVDHREVVRGGESQFGLHAAEVDGLLLFGRRGASRPARGGEFLEDVALSVPELDVRGLGHVVEYAHAEFLRRLSGQHRAEEDVFEIGSGVLFRIFEIGHGDDFFNCLFDLVVWFCRRGRVLPDLLLVRGDFLSGNF